MVMTHYLKSHDRYVMKSTLKRLVKIDPNLVDIRQAYVLLNVIQIAPFFVNSGMLAAASCHRY